MLSDNLVGKTIKNDFVITEVIGKGGMAIVYRAQQISMQRDVALKVITLNTITEENNFSKRFEREVSTIAQLEHIHILPVYSYGIEADVAFLAMRLLRGGTLQDYINRHAPLDFEEIASLFSQIAKGIGYGHSKGIIHRDIKASNILLDDNMNAFISDFGLAKIVDTQHTFTTDGTIIGTVSYMSPEQLRGEYVDHRSDLYSLGVLLYVMVTGQTPFGGDNSSDIVSAIYKHLEEAPRMPSKFRKDIPIELEMVILKALSKDPEQRYQNANHFLNDVKLAIGISLSTTDRLRKTDIFRIQEDYTPRRAKNKTVWYGLGAVVITIMLAMLAFVFSNTLGGPDQLRPGPGEAYQILANTVINSENLTLGEETLSRALDGLAEGDYIAFITCNQSSEYHATLAREIVNYAKTFGIQVKVFDSDSQEHIQRLKIEQAMADNHVKGILICPLSEATIQEPLLEIEREHMPLVIVGSALENNYGGVIISNDDDNYGMGFEAGLFAGAYIRDELAGQANVVILDYPTLPDLVRRANGLEEGVLQLAPQAKIIGRYQGATEDFGYESIQALIEDKVDFNIIVSINDAGSYGAIKALEEADIDPQKVFISSIDAELRALDYVKDNYYIQGTLSLEGGRTQTAESTIRLMLLMMANETVPERVSFQIGKMVTKETLSQD
ncbi:hypothetical protein MASR2M15_10460 [Anaerolineales bacterium]